MLKLAETGREGSAMDTAGPAVASSDGVEWLDDMAWVAPQYTAEQINRAGRVRVDPKATDEAREAVLSIINNWRSAHSFPLNSFQMTLRDRASRVDAKAVVAQRLKRLTSIEAKLRRFDHIRLAQMQDIGGCRAVVSVEELKQAYQQSESKNPKGRHVFIKENDYIAEPKDDGYRSVHLIYRYFSASARHRPYLGMKTEIQLRSRLQHIWATAVETVDTFTGDPMKAGRGEQQWRRFFALMGSALALKERRPTVPGTPNNPTALVTELRALTKSLGVKNSLEAWRSALRWLPDRVGHSDAFFFLMFLDTAVGSLTVEEFKKEDILKAQETYAAVEKNVEAQAESRQAVLVSVKHLSSLRTAYPNYFLDTAAFLREVSRAIA
jgi:hypothetical protein